MSFPQSLALELGVVSMHRPYFRLKLEIWDGAVLCGYEHVGIEQARARLSSLRRRSGSFHETQREWRGVPHACRLGHMVPCVSGAVANCHAFGVQ